MATNDPFLAGSGALWLQEFPNREPQYLGCHELGGVAAPKGDITLLWCPDPSEPNKFQVVSSFQSAPGPVTTTLTTDVQKLADYLELWRDRRVNLYVHKIDTGRMNIFTNYERSFILPYAAVTSEGLENMAVRDPDTQERSNQTFDISAEGLYRPFRMLPARASHPETVALNGILFYNRKVGNKLIREMYGIAVADADVGLTANVWFTTDGGASWAAGSADPFAADEHIVGGPHVLEIDRDTTRILVGRGSTDVANPLEVAYTDNDGTTWVNVDVGSTNGQYFLGPKALFVLDKYNIWAAVNAGYVYFSEDGGVTWAARQSAAGGQATTEDLYAVHFASPEIGVAVGANNAIIRTLDGGTAWSAITGPAGQAGVTVRSVFVFDQYNWWIGYADGALFFTEDGGSTWTERSHPLTSNAGALVDMDWYNEFIGILVQNPVVVHGSNDGNILWTINGGYDWELLSTPANLGLNSVEFLTERIAHVAGEVQNGTAVVLKVSGG